MSNKPNLLAKVSPLRQLRGHIAPSTHSAPATRPPRGSAANPIRPRRRRPWVAVTDPKGSVVGERMAPARVKGSGS